MTPTELKAQLDSLAQTLRTLPHLFNLTSTDLHHRGGMLATIEGCKAVA